MEKQCTKCKTTKLICNFSNYFRSKDGKKPACKDCCKSNKIKIIYSSEDHSKYILHFNITHKKCSVCKEDKEIIFFGLSSASKDGKRNDCKSCIILYGEKNKERLALYRKKRYEKYSEQICDILKYNRRLKNPEKYNCKLQPSIKKKNYSIQIEDKILEEIKLLYDGIVGARTIAKKIGISRNYVIKAYKILGLDNSKIKPPHKNLDKIKEKRCKDCEKIFSISNFRKRNSKKSATGISYEPYCNECEKFRGNELGKKRSKRLRKENPGFAIHKDISARIWKAIKGNKNKESCIKYLPFSIEELKIHLESMFEDWMSWQNYGGYKLSEWNEENKSTWKWNLDHIIPHSKFKYLSMEDQSFKDCWSLCNLRPYSAKQNLLDGVSKIRHV